MKRGRLGDPRVRGPGEVPVCRHGPFFLPSPKQMGSESDQVLKSFYVSTLSVLVSKYFLKSTNRLNFPFCMSVRETLIYFVIFFYFYFLSIIYLNRIVKMNFKFVF